MASQYEPLSCQLTQEEKLEFAQQIAFCEIEILSITEEKKSLNRNFFSQLKDLRTKIEDLSRIIKSGQIDRDVEIEWIKNDPRPGMKTMYRMDTGEKVRVEPMSGEDDPKFFEN